MPDIQTKQVEELTETSLQPLARNVVNIVRLAAEKAVAHHANPSGYPLPQDAGSLEHLFASRFTTLGPLKQQAAKARVVSTLGLAAERNARYGSLARVNLSSPQPIRAQARGVLASLVPDERMITALRAMSAAPLQPTFPADAPDKLELRLLKVRCVDETGGGWFGELGEDEISLGGTLIDAEGKTTKLPAFHVGDFDDGDAVVYNPPRRFATCSLRTTTSWPKSYVVIMALAEVDQGGFADFLNRLVEEVREEVTTYLASLIGGWIGSTVGPLGTLVGLVVGYCVGKAIKYLQDWWGDEIFNPVTVEVKIPGPGAMWSNGATDSPNALAVFGGHEGEYRIAYDWRVYK